MSRPIALFSAVFSKKQEGYSIDVPISKLVKLFFRYYAEPSILSCGCDVRDTVQHDYLEPQYKLMRSMFQTVSTPSYYHA